MADNISACKASGIALLITPLLASYLLLSDASARTDMASVNNGQHVPVRHEAGVDLFLIPDDFHRPQDGGDDAPSINRAIAFLKQSGRNQLKFLARRYRLRSPVKQFDVAIHWCGSGWSESYGAATAEQGLGRGTWLVIEHPGFTPVEISGIGSRGTVVSDIGVFEKQPDLSSSGSWQPTAYSYVFDVEATYGLVRFEHVMLLAVTRGINAHLSGRLQVDGLYGQVFDNAVKVDKAFDADSYQGFHIWPFWSQAIPVMAYTQSHLDALWLERADTGFIDKMFVFGARSGVRLGQSEDDSISVPGGVATKNTIGALHCDFTRWCIWITGTNVHFQADDIDSQGQRWAKAGDPAIALAQTASIRVEGQAVIQAGRVWQEVTDHSTISYLNRQLASNIQIGSLYEDFSYADQRPAHATMVTVTSGQSLLFISAPPMVVKRPDQTLLNGDETTNGHIKSP